MIHDQDTTMADERSSKSFLGGLRQYIKEFNPNHGNENGKEAAKKNLQKAWTDWVNNFEDCLKLEEIPQEKWLQILKILGGQQLREKIGTLSADGATYEDVKTALDDYFKDKRAINAVRYEFFNMNQRAQETTRE